MKRPTFALLAAALFVAAPAGADNTLTVAEPALDPPTLVALGVSLPITGDDNFNAKVTVRYKKSGTSDWHDALPLFRVHPESLQKHAPPPMFAGSVFDLRPATSYDLELHAVDPDGGDVTKAITGKTRPVPGDPPAPRAVKVTDVATLNAALAAAAPGDVITLANGTYAGSAIGITKGGADGNPVVVRGESQDGVVLDGGNCTGCNLLEVNASFVSIESLTIQNVERAIRIYPDTATGVVIRRVHAKNVQFGFHGTGPNQSNFYVADNVLEGRIAWPRVYSDGDGADWPGIEVSGNGNVVAYNRISGFADAMTQGLSETPVVANDFYGNDVLWTYDDGVQLDETLRNSRFFRNRLTNVYDGISFQPVYGGPAYAFRNQLVNVKNEELKIHSQGGDSETSGLVIYDNTFVKPYEPFITSSAAAPHYVVFANNMFVGPGNGGFTFRFDQPLGADVGTFDYDGFSPDGKFEFGYGAGGVTYDSFAAMVAAAKYETHGVLLAGTIFASGLATPTDYKPLLPPADVSLAKGAGAIDKGTPLAQIAEGAPDLGAIELGCAPPYGPRAVGIDESTMDPTGCPGAPGGADGGVPPGGDAGAGPDGSISSGGPGGGDGGVAGDTPGSGSSSGGGCGCRAAAGPSFAGDAALVIGLAIWLRRARRRPRSRAPLVTGATM